MKTKTKQQAIATNQQAVATDPYKRNRHGQWVKGGSGNPLGRPREALSDLCRREISKVKLSAGLGDIFLRRGRYKDAQVSDCIRAAQLLLAYGFGPPRPDVELGDGSTIKVIYEKRSRVEISGTASESIEGDPGSGEIQYPGLRATLGQDSIGAGSND